MTSISVDFALEALNQVFLQYQDEIPSDIRAKLTEDLHRFLIENTNGFEEGFEDLPKRITLHLDNSNSPPWYIWNSETQSRDYVQKPVLRARVNSLALQTSRDEKGLENPDNKKLLIRLEKYNIVVGYLTVFAKTFLWNLYHWLKENKQHHGAPLAIRIAAQAKASGQSSSRRFVSCRLFRGGDRIIPIRSKVEYPKDWDEFSWMNFIEKSVNEINEMIGVGAIESDVAEEEGFEEESVEMAVPPVPSVGSRAPATGSRASRVPSPVTPEELSSDVLPF